MTEECLMGREVDGGSCSLPNGCTLYWKRNEIGGRTYFSDEIGGMISEVWDTSLISDGSILAALVNEKRLSTIEQISKQKES